MVYVGMPWSDYLSMCVWQEQCNGKNVQMVYIYTCGDVYCKYNVCICFTVEDVRFQSKQKNVTLVQEKIFS